MKATRDSKALVILSGGQDSATALFWALNYFEEVHALTFDYHQRNSRELRAAQDLCKLARVPQEIVTVGPIMVGTSPMIDLTRQFQIDGTAPPFGKAMRQAFVPGLNMLFTAIAANRAYFLNATSLITGICQEDGGSFPDATPEFIEAQGRALMIGLGSSRFNILSPLSNLSKVESIKLAMQLPGPICSGYEALAFSHTAFNNEYPPLGGDPASNLRDYGFEQAGVPDPLVIRACREGLMRLPDTSNYQDQEFCVALAERIQSLKDKLGVGGQ